MRHELLQLPDVQSVASRAAAFVTERARVAIAQRGRFDFAVSGGRTPWAMFARLAAGDAAWEQAVFYQVDERVAAAGSPDRNLTHLRQTLGGIPAHIVAMAVERPDLDAAAADYAALLPERFDLVHLGLGADGHCASLVPADPVLEVTDRLVGLTEPYQWHRRMTLTYPALSRADQLLWLITGADKHDALARLLRGDDTIPAGRVHADASLIMADQAAAAPDPAGTVKEERDRK
ncbi:6-phosphogluconolactonase [Candidatus Mycobacterium methanotrophicum]|uniref:6-phosphogluconolactonase n=1 Tax=Candidatus Mycobacterium methanotrophicum TaxID=2943498 RepID=A0ABY4QJV0_9MYCO|nr:6-phosphogluconolactonase [Candidatus Mycobacterium methanotrophicum]UQX11292.1 6-phosphogluconolactonase [Candidatus Mycobacterium methanotrophicum]